MRIPNPDTIRSLAIRCPNWIGDAVMATPAIRLIRTLFRNASITALCTEPIAELLSGLDTIDHYLIVPKKLRPPTAQATYSVIREKKFDLGILLTQSFSSAWMLWKAHIPLRLGYKTHFRRLLLNVPVRLPEEGQHDVQTYLDVIKPFGTASSAPQLELHVTEEEKKSMQARISTPHDRVIINPGAAYGSAKCWPPEYFQDLASRLLSQTQATCIFVGDQRSIPLINTILAKLPKSQRLINQAGQTSIRELMALISIGSCVISNDSGPMHIAAALRRPLVAIFGSTNPRRTGPWNHGEVLYANVACSPCYLRQCPIDFRCMRRILPSTVFEHVKQLVD